MKKALKIGVVVLIVVLGGIQLVPVERSNPPVTSEVPATPEARAVLRRACYDCHSNETVWPWYSHVAPISWLVAQDVAEAREEINFSTWDAYSPKKRAKILEEVPEETAEGEMPLKAYLLMHPEARLSSADLATLRAWAGAGSGEGDRSGHGRGRGHDDDDDD